MARPKPSDGPPLRFETDRIEGTPHWVPIYCAAHHFENLEKGLTKCPYGCPPGPQVRILWSPAFEILAGGARMGTKTEAGRGFLIKGNFDEIAVHPKGEHIMHGIGDEAYCGICTNISYITHPRYRALILRENEKDLADWLSRARILYKPMGANVTEKPARVTWPSGATFVLGHMRDESSYTDYMGQEYHRILFEELTQVAEELLYLRIRSSCRSTFECDGKCKQGQCTCGALKPQILSTTNPGGKGHCVPFGEVLTPQGWVDISTFSVGDPVYTVNPNGGLEETVVSQVHCTEYSGDMVEVNIRGLKMVCTPNHSVAKIGGYRAKGIDTRTSGSKLFSLSQFEDLPGQSTILRSVADWVGKPLGAVVPPKIKTRARKLDQPGFLTGELFCHLLGWYLSEGCIVDRDKAFTIAQIKSNTRKKLETVLHDCGFKMSWSKTGVNVYAPDWYEYLSQFGMCFEKFIPSEIKNATREELGCLFESLMDGDGHWVTKNSGVYYTSSPQLADDVCEIAVKLGYIVYLSTRMREGKNHISHEVHFMKKKSGGTEILTGHHKYGVQTKTKRRSDISISSFNGKVYCIGVSGTHTFVIRQKGSVWISGNSWVKKRFINVGKPNEIYTDPNSGLTRIYIPATVKDNPYALRSGQYEKQLNDLPEPTRSAWLLGDWDALGGQYFRDFRPKGPLTGDPPGDVARHVIPDGSMALAPFWPRWIGADWGYDHGFAVYWCCRTDTGQTVVYREMAGNETDSSSLGAAIGRASLPDLMAMDRAGVPPKMQFWLSFDAFSRDANEHTVAAHIARGIDSVLGEGAAYIPEFDVSVLNTVGGIRPWDMSDVKKAQKQRDFGITIEKAINDRVLGWQHIRDLLRFKQLSDPLTEKYNQQYAMELLHQDVDLYKEYLRSYEARKPEILPRLLIYDSCIKIIEAIPTAVHKEGTEDVLKVQTLEDDCLDGLRYALFSENVHTIPEPQQSFVKRKIEEAKRLNPDMDYNSLVWVARSAEDQFKHKNGQDKPFNMRPESSRFFKRRVH